MQPRNLLFIMSDEHSRRVLGCHGHPMIRTPNLDRLASRGVRFTDAYCNSPICVPSRASFQTGRYVHEIRFWDNAIAYDGSVPSWAHRLKAAGHRVEFDRQTALPQRRGRQWLHKEHMPLHVVDGHRRSDRHVARSAAAAQGGFAPCRRRRLRRFHLSGLRRPHHARGRELADGTRQRQGRASRGCCSSRSCARTSRWSPAREWYNLYPEDKVPWPNLYANARAPEPPLSGGDARLPDLRPGLRRSQQGAQGDRRLLRPGELCRSQCRAAVARRSTTTGLTGDTRVIYTSDHGDNLGTRGLWGKSNMYEEVGRRADAHGRTRGAGRCRLPRTGVAGRLLPTIVDVRRPGAPPRRCRSARRPAHGHRCAAGLPRAPS